MQEQEEAAISSCKVCSPRCVGDGKHPTMVDPHLKPARKWRQDQGKHQVRKPYKAAPRCLLVTHKEPPQSLYLSAQILAARDQPPSPAGVGIKERNTGRPLLNLDQCSRTSSNRAESSQKKSRCQKISSRQTVATETTITRMRGRRRSGGREDRCQRRLSVIKSARSCPRFTAPVVETSPDRVKGMPDREKRYPNRETFSKHGQTNQGQVGQSRAQQSQNYAKSGKIRKKFLKYPSDPHNSS